MWRNVVCQRWRRRATTSGTGGDNWIFPADLRLRTASNPWIYGHKLDKTPSGFRGWHSAWKGIYPLVFLPSSIKDHGPVGMGPADRLTSLSFNMRESLHASSAAMQTLKPTESGLTIWSIYIQKEKKNMADNFTHRHDILSGDWITMYLMTRSKRNKAAVGSFNLQLIL